MTLRAFPGSGPEIELNYLKSAKWLLATMYGNAEARAWCAKHGVPVEKAAGEGIGSSGAYLVPTTLANAIIDIRDKYGAFRRRALVWQMSSDSEIIIRRPGGATPVFMTENSAPSGEAIVNVDTINLTAKKIGALVRLSSELNEDGAMGAVDVIANEIAFAFAKQEDDCAFNGDGTSTYGKMTGVSNIVLDGKHSKAKVTGANNTFATLNATDLSNLIGGIQASALANAAWFVSEIGFALTFCRIAAGGGYMDSRIVDGVATPFYLGFPVIAAQSLPQITTTLSGKVMLAFGDMYRAGVLGERRGITLAKSSDRYLDQDQIAVLGTQRFHTVIHNAGDNTNFGSIAALVGS